MAGRAVGGVPRALSLLVACCVVARVHAISPPRPAFSDRRDSKPVLSAAIEPSKQVLLARRSKSKITRRQCVLFSITYLTYVAIYFARKPVAVVKSTLETDLGMSIASLGAIDTCAASPQLLSPPPGSMAAACSWAP